MNVGFSNASGVCFKAPVIGKLHHPDILNIMSPQKYKNYI